MKIIWALFWCLIVLSLAYVLYHMIKPVPPVFVEVTRPSEIVREPELLRPSREQAIAKKEDLLSKQMLNSFFEPARTYIPRNYPKKKIGECPISKPLSEDLPIVDVPLCVATQSSSFQLSQI
jgi:hypothetical protein